MTTIQPQQPPSRAWHPTWVDVNIMEQLDGSLTDALEHRIERLEEALVSRRARRRLRREIRESAKAYSWAGSFAAARLEATTFDWLNRPGPRVDLELPPLPDADR